MIFVPHALISGFVVLHIDFAQCRFYFFARLAGFSRV